jgi:glucan phosphoethanolaminetransferase (alkaline phosphatase superfamily)
MMAMRNSAHRAGGALHRAGAEWLLLALFPFLLSWKCFLLLRLHFFTLFTWRRQAIVALGISFLQDLLLGCALYFLLTRYVRARRFGFSALVYVVCNIIAVFYLADVRCKIVLLQPLTWRAVFSTLHAGSMMLSSVPMFTGKLFLQFAIGSLVALNVATLILPLAPRLTGRLKWLFFEGRWTKAAPLAAVFLFVLCVLSPPQPYHAESNIFTSGLISYLRSGASSPRPQISKCDEKLRPLGHPAMASPLSGAAQGRNVLIFIGETWSYWDTSIGDPERDSTPFLRELAQIGPISTKAYTQVPYSTKAIYGILTGRYASAGVEIVESAYPSIDSLAKILGKEGYYTGLFSAQYLDWDYSGRQYLAMGFSEVRGAEEIIKSAQARGRKLDKNSWGVNDEELLEGIISEFPSDRPFFAVLYSASTHHPYVCKEPTLSGEDLAHRRFQCALRSSDDVLRRLVGQLKERGMFSNTVIVVVGDHGENFEDGRFLPRGCTMTDAELSAPLVVAAPGLSERSLSRGERTIDVSGARQIDIVPTVVDLLGLVSDTPVQGRSLLSGENPPAAYVNSFGACDVAGLVEGDTKYLYNFETGEAWSSNLGAKSRESGAAPVHPNAQPELRARLESCSGYNEAQVRGEVVSK